MCNRTIVRPSLTCHLMIYLSGTLSLYASVTDSAAEYYAKSSYLGACRLK